MDIFYKGKSMKVLSIKQPWAGLICRGIKDIENRSWKPKNFTGRILIHSSQKWDGNFRCMNFLFTKKQWDCISKKLQSDLIIQTKFKTSAIIGSVEVVDYTKYSESIWADSESIHWILKNPLLFEQPILNIKGRLRLWNYELQKEVTHEN